MVYWHLWLYNKNRQQGEYVISNSPFRAFQRIFYSFFFGLPLPPQLFTPSQPFLFGRLINVKIFTAQFTNANAYTQTPQQRQLLINNFLFLCGVLREKLKTTSTKYLRRNYRGLQKVSMINQFYGPYKITVFWAKKGWNLFFNNLEKCLKNFICDIY